MQQVGLSMVGGLVVALASMSSAVAGGIAMPRQTASVPSMVQPVHSLYEAEATLHRRGYHDVRVERPTLPYSFNACKRGVRYHIHVDYYGDLVQVDPVGRCYGNGYGYGPGSYRDRYYSYGDRYRNGDGYYRRNRYWD